MIPLPAEDWVAVWLSLRISATAALAALPVGILVALALERGRFPGRVLLDALVTLPLVLPPVVTGYLLLLSFGRRGPIGRLLQDWFGVSLSFSWQGAALAAAVMAFPLMVRLLRLSLAAVDRGLEQAAGSAGAPPLARFLLITLPLMAPGVLAALILGFAKALGEFGATITFVSAIPGETRTLPAALYGYTQIPGGEGPAQSLALIAILLALGATLLAELLVRLGAGRRG